MKRRHSILVLGLMLGLGCAAEVKSPSLPLTREFQSYSSDIQPIFNRRCAVCHSCNDAPCSFDMTAFAGVDRGATAVNVYEDRLFSIDPMRLFIDAKSTDQWREKGFFPVIYHHPSGDPRNLDDSILFQLLDYRGKHELPAMKFDAFSSRQCPDLRSTVSRATSEIAAIFRVDAHADLGMPYGFPALSREEHATIRDWLVRGAPGPDAEQNASKSASEDAPRREEFETFLNRDDAKQKLVSRFLYEHLFYAHLYFSGPAGSPRFYRLVRSRTPEPFPIDEIATRLPYNDPGTSRFWYRLRPIEAVIVHKTHLPFELAPDTLSHWQELFSETPWSLTDRELPTYEDSRGANPFVTFAKIPPLARYRFMLENAEYFVSSFMKGPVCRGQIALNVIDDQFFIFFLDPSADQSVVSDEYLEQTGKFLITPFRPEDLFARAADGSLWSILELPIRAIRQLRQSFYPYYKSRQLRYLSRSDEFYRKARPLGFSLSDIWNGGGTNPNAVLTVFRHHDSASVLKGAWGGTPKTVLILDYPIFERMYYNLVVSFDIFSDIKVQLSTRLYMDDLRIEGEDLFLRFLPLQKRKPLRDFWYRKAERKIGNGDYPLYGTTDGVPRGTQIRFETEHPKEELVEKILRERIPQHLGGLRDYLNRGGEAANAQQFLRVESGEQLDAALASLGGKSRPYVAVLPDLFFVRFRSEPRGLDRVYTFIRNRGHFNVKYLFDEESRFAEDEDTLTILQGFHGSYPNFFFDVPALEAKLFLVDFLKLKKGDDSFSNLVHRFGVRRRDPHFWEASDFFAGRFRADSPVEAGLFDLNRYADY